MSWFWFKHIQLEGSIGYEIPAVCKSKMQYVHLDHVFLCENILPPRSTSVLMFSFVTLAGLIGFLARLRQPQLKDTSRASRVMSALAMYDFQNWRTNTTQMFLARAGKSCQMSVIASSLSSVLCSSCVFHSLSLL